MENSNIHAQIAASNQALNRGDLEQAYNLAVRLLNSSEGKKLSSVDRTKTLVLAGSALMLANKPNEASKLFQEAKALSPERLDILAYLSRCYLATMQILEARELCVAALNHPEANSLNNQALTTIGVVLSHCQDYETALVAFERALAKNEKDAQLHVNLAGTYKYLGNFKNAELYYERAITLAPEFGQAFAGLAEIPNYENRQSRIDRLEALRESEQNSEFKHYSLALEYERASRYADAFEAFTKSAESKKQRTKYDFKQDQLLFRSVRNSIDEKFLNEAIESKSQLKPIFIVGMPRTGTTLVDRILSNHPDVSGLGELKYLPAVIKQQSRSKLKNALNTEIYKQASAFDYAEIAEKYEQLIENLHHCNGIFTDKLPINFFNIGIIRKAFPRCKVIILRRKPLDTCLSNFRQLFAKDSIHQYYSNSIEDVANYYIEYDRLIKHWKALYKEDIFEIQYEQLVDQPEKTIRALTQYCDLSWRETCLEFHQNPSPLATASAYQARQPIYKESAKRVEHYLEFLEPARKLLSKANLI